MLNYSDTTIQTRLVQRKGIILPPAVSYSLASLFEKSLNCTLSFGGTWSVGLTSQKGKSGIQEVKMLTFLREPQEDKRLRIVQEVANLHDQWRRNDD